MFSRRGRHRTFRRMLSSQVPREPMSSVLPPENVVREDSPILRKRDLTHFFLCLYLLGMTVFVPKAPKGSTNERCCASRLNKIRFEINILERLNIHTWIPGPVATKTKTGKRGLVLDTGSLRLQRNPSSLGPTHAESKGNPADTEGFSSMIALFLPPHNFCSCLPCSSIAHVVFCLL